MRLMKLMMIGLAVGVFTTNVTQAHSIKGNQPAKSDQQATAVTVTGTVSAGTDSKGATTYSIAGDDGTTYTLKGHESDLATYKDKRATITGKEADKGGVKTLKVKTVKEAPAKTA